MSKFRVHVKVEVEVEAPSQYMAERRVEPVEQAMKIALIGLKHTDVDVHAVITG